MELKQYQNLQLEILSKEIITFIKQQEKIYHDPSSKWAQTARKKTKRLRVRYSPKPTYFGYIISDTVERITDGVKDYFISAIDVKSKFCMTLMYKHQNSEKHDRFLQPLQICISWNYQNMAI